MTDTRWTAGPWELHNGTDIFGPLGGDSGDGVCADSNDGWQVAEVGHYASFVDGELVALGDDCRRANRQLIAAAPELYEAVDRLLPMALDDASQYGDNPSEDEDIIFARAALAKARGEL